MNWWVILNLRIAIKNDYQSIWKYLAQIPIVKPTVAMGDKISGMVSAFLSEESGDRSSSVLREAEIDRLVYGFYGLTEEEIRVVEGG
jgi:hypothetical protein